MNIVDIIDHRNKYTTQRFVVLDRLPEFVFERHGNWLIAMDEIAMGFYRYEQPHGDCRAFGGAEFGLRMADGSIEKASGQWWHPIAHPEFRDLVCEHGVATVEGLASCYVFSGGVWLDRSAVDDWLRCNEPSNNHRRYDSGHQDFGKHRIDSKWEALA